MKTDSTISNDRHFDTKEPVNPRENQMKTDIWNDKSIKPIRKLHGSDIIITKFGSCLSETDIDNGCIIEADWCELGNLLRSHQSLLDKVAKLESELQYRIERLKEPIIIRGPGSTGKIWTNGEIEKLQREHQEQSSKIERLEKALTLAIEFIKTVEDGEQLDDFGICKEATETLKAITRRQRFYPVIEIKYDFGQWQLINQHCGFETTYNPTFCPMCHKSFSKKEQHNLFNI